MERAVNVQALDEPRGLLVGRDRELAELVGASRATHNGQARLCMLVGEPGIGKTRLAEEIAAHAAAGGAAVVWGRCSEEGDAPAYLPWTQVLRGVVRATDRESLAALVGAVAVHLAPIVPELRELLPDVLEGPREPPIDHERARFHLFDAAVTILRRIAVARPLVVVIDDLHAADRPSLLLLGFLAREMRDDRILIVCCYRDLEVRRRPDLAAMLGEIGRYGRRMPLRGISEADVGRYMEHAADVVPPQSIVAAVHRATDGNPFFVEEVVRLLIAEGRLARMAGLQTPRLGIPEGVREAIRRRIAPLQAECDEVLSVAAVIGRTFDVQCLERVSGRPRAWLVQVLDDALAAGIVRDVDDAPGRYTFSHALIRETLYADTPPTQRLDLHRRVGGALEEIYGADWDPHLPELAHHFFVAAPIGDAERALAYCVAAAERARRLLACEEAVTHYDRALSMLAFLQVDEPRRCDLLLALGEAQDIAGDIEGAKVTFHRAARIARELRAPELLARAALGAGGQWAEKFTSSTFDKSDIPLLEEALGALVTTDSALRVKLLARLALSLFLAVRREQGVLLGADAVDMARRLGDHRTLAYALRVRHGVLLGPDHNAARLRVSNELDELAATFGDPELALRVQALRSIDLLEIGEAERAEAALQAHARLAQELRDPFDLWLSMMMRATWAHLRGRLDEGERLSQEAFALARRMPGQQAAEENADVCRMLQMYIDKRERGTLADFEEAVRHRADRYVTVPGFRAVLGLVYCELGREAEARRELERLSSIGFSVLPRDFAWLLLMTMLAEMCVALRDVPRATLIYDLISPFAHCVVATVTAGCTGGVARYLGLLATLLERWEDAERHFEGAIAIDARLGARGFVAHSQYAHAAMLLARGRRTDRERAASLLRESIAVANELGFVVLARRASTLASHDEAPPDAEARGCDERGTPCASGESVFRQEGDYWTIGFAGKVVRLRAGKGLTFLAAMLPHPGRDFPAVELASGGGAGSLGDAGEVFDARTAEAYRGRIEELAEALDGARAAGDGEAAIVLQDELDVVSAELARGVGFAGRLRPAASHVERARVSVTRTIRGAIARIGAVHPELGRHLRATVRTGIVCSYTPDPRVPLAWIL